MWVYELKENKGEITKGNRSGNHSDKIKVKVLTSGINRRDVWIQQGLYPGISYPIVLGSDACVEYQDEQFLLNPNIDWGWDPKVPQSSYNILGLENDGCFAENVWVAEDRLCKVPSHMSTYEAGVLGLAGLTAYRALISNCKVEKKDSVFINGIGGAVALMAMQFALALGCEVHVSSSSEAKLEEAIKMGASGGTNYKNESWGKTYKKERGGFDVIIDSAGGKGFNELINLCNIGGRIGIYGGTRGKIEGISPQHLFFKQIHIFGSTMGNDEEFQLMLKFVEKYKIKPVIDKVFPINKINEAFEYALDKNRFGKVCFRHDI